MKFLKLKTPTMLGVYGHSVYEQYNSEDGKEAILKIGDGCGSHEYYWTGDGPWPIWNWDSRYKPHHRDITESKASDNYRKLTKFLASCPEAK